jgi:hypothetical protein
MTTTNSNTGIQNLSYLRTNMARALVGRWVSQSGYSNSIIQGQVAGVRMNSGLLQLEVSGRAYDLSQVLTSTPMSLCP